jgi:hypothetical protein
MLRHMIQKEDPKNRSHLYYISYYRYENKDSKKPFSSSLTVSSVRSESKTEHASVDKGNDYSSARRCFVCGGPHFKRDYPMRREGASNHSSVSSSSGSNRRFNPAAKAKACAAGQQTTNINDSQLASPAVQEGVDAHARRCKVRSAVKTPPSLTTRTDCETSLINEGVNSFEVTAAVKCDNKRSVCNSSECSEPYVDVTENEFYHCQYTMIEVKKFV